MKNSEKFHSVRNTGKTFKINFKTACLTDYVMEMGCSMLHWYVVIFVFVTLFTVISPVHDMPHWLRHESDVLYVTSQVRYFFIPFKGKRGCHTWIRNTGIKWTCVRYSQPKAVITYKCHKHYLNIDRYMVIGHKCSRLCSQFSSLQTHLSHWLRYTRDVLYVTPV